MPRPLCALAVLGVLAVLAAPHDVAAYHETTVHLEPRIWFPTLSAEVQSSREGLTGDVLTDSDLALDDPVAPGGVATLRFGRHTLRVEGFGVSSDGDTRVDRTFNFGGRTYTVASRVVSEFDARVLAADYGYDVVRLEALALAVTLGARIVDADAKLTAPDRGFSAEASFQGVVPAVGLAVVAHPAPIPPFSSLALVFRLSGLTIGDRGEFFDLEGAAEWLPLPNLALRAGYRFVHGKGKEGGDRAKFDLSGPYVGATLSF